MTKERVYRLEAAMADLRPRRATRPAQRRALRQPRGTRRRGGPEFARHGGPKGTPRALARRCRRAASQCLKRPRRGFPTRWPRRRSLKADRRAGTTARLCRVLLRPPCGRGPASRSPLSNRNCAAASRCDRSTGASPPEARWATCSVPMKSSLGTRPSMRCRLARNWLGWMFRNRKHEGDRIPSEHPGEGAEEQHTPGPGRGHLSKNGAIRVSDLANDLSRLDPVPYIDSGHEDTGRRAGMVRLQMPGPRARRLYEIRWRSRRVGAFDDPEIGQDVADALLCPFEVAGTASSLAAHLRVDCGNAELTRRGERPPGKTSRTPHNVGAEGDRRLSLDSSHLTLSQLVSGQVLNRVCVAAAMDVKQQVRLREEVLVKGVGDAQGRAASRAAGEDAG